MNKLNKSSAWVRWGLKAAERANANGNVYGLLLYRVPCCLDLFNSK